MADDSILPLLFLGGAGYLLWKYYQQTPAAASQPSQPAANFNSILYSPLAEQTPPLVQIIPPPAPPIQSYTAAPGANSANSGASPFALFNFGSSAPAGQPGWNAPDPSIYRTTPEQAAQQAAAITATAHAAAVAEGPGSIDLSCYTKCYTTWGNLIPGCVC